MASDKSRRHQGAHAKRAYWCSCGRVVHGNGAKASHRAMHERRADGHRYIGFERFHALFPDWRPGP